MKAKELAVFLVCLVGVKCDLTVKTKNGDVLGFNLKSIPDGKEFAAFTGIPYAKPPIGELRFEDPVPAEPWSGVLEAKNPAPKCAQTGMLTNKPEGQEDCLYLNVYTPKASSTESKAVMVWIHGGGWVSGSGNAADDIYGPEYLMNEDVVLVTINYRLNVFGFLSTGDKTAPGNYGLLDMVLALKWVQDNIQAFGGDPSLVTIFGESAGAGAVHLLMLSPLTTGLFHKAIAQSGSAFCPWAIETAEIETTNKIAAFAGCSGDFDEAISCLKKVPADVLVSSQDALKIFGETPLSLSPRVDKERSSPFLPETPETLITTGRFNDVPFITGITRNEGYFLHALTKALGENGYPLLNGADRHRFTASYLQLIYALPSSVLEKAVDDVLFHYLGHRDPITHADVAALTQMNSDRWFNKCFYNTMQKHSTYGRQPVYAYVYSHHGQFTFPKILGLEMSQENQNYVSHADELTIMFKAGFLPVLQEEDLNMSRIMVGLWTSFAQTGTPQFSDLSWSRITPWDFQFLDLTTTPEMRKEDDYPFKDFSIWDRTLALKNDVSDSQHRTKTEL